MNTRERLARWLHSVILETVPGPLESEEWDSLSANGQFCLEKADDLLALIRGEPVAWLWYTPGGAKNLNDRHPREWEHPDMIASVRPLYLSASETSRDREAARKLAMFMLQSEFYIAIPELREAVDAILEADDEK